MPELDALNVPEEKKRGFLLVHLSGDITPEAWRDVMKELRDGVAEGFRHLALATDNLETIQPDDLKELCAFARLCDRHDIVVEIRYPTDRIKGAIDWIDRDAPIVYWTGSRYWITCPLCNRQSYVDDDVLANMYETTCPVCHGRFQMEARYVKKGLEPFRGPAPKESGSGRLPKQAEAASKKGGCLGLLLLIAFVLLLPLLL